MACMPSMSAWRAFCLVRCVRAAQVAQERRKLLLEGRQLMSACQALTDQQTSKVEAEEAAYTSEHAVACEKLEEAKRRVRTEGKAVEVLNLNFAVESYPNLALTQP